MKPRNPIFFLGALALLLATSASAQSTYNWTSATDGSWGNSTNWTTTGVPGTVATDLAVFNTASTGPIITLDGNRTLSSLTFGSTNPAWTLNPGTPTTSALTVATGASRLVVNATTLHLNTALNAGASTNEFGVTGNGGTVNFTRAIGRVVLGTSGTSGAVAITYNLNASNIVTHTLSVGFNNVNISGNFPVNSVASTTVNANFDQTATVDTFVGGGSNTGNAGVLVIRNGATWTQNGASVRIGYSSSDGTAGKSHGRVDVGVVGDSTGNLTIGTGGSLILGTRAGTGILNINHGTVTVNGNTDTPGLTAYIYLSSAAGTNNLNGATGILNLNAGGTLVTARQFVTTGGNGSGTFNFNGGLLQINRSTGLVTTDLFNSDPAQNITLNVQNGGARIDTQAHNTVINRPLVGAGTGSLEKLGSGTLTLNGLNTYLGATRVTAGTLAINGSSILDITDLVVENGATIHLTNTETVHALFFGTPPQVQGTWGATGSGAAHIDDTRFSGPGLLLVQEWSDPDAPIFTQAQAQQIADNLFPFIDLDAPGLATVKTLYQAGSHTPALAAYMDYFLRRLAAEGAGLPLDPLSDVDALYRTSVTSVPTTNATAARDEVDALLTALRTAAVSNLELALNDADPLEFGAAIARIAATPWAGGTPLMQTLAASQPKTAADPFSGTVANQIFWTSNGSINQVAKWLPSFDHFKKVTEPYPDPLNTLGLGEWSFKMEFLARNLGGALAPITESAFIHPDGSGLEQSPGYHRLLLADFLEEFHLFEGTPWYDQIRRNELTRANRFLINISKLQRTAGNGTDGGRFGLGSEPATLFTSPGTGNIATLYSTQLGDTFGTDLRTAVSTGNPALAPAYSSLTFPFGGYTVFRNRWTRDAFQTFFHNRDNAPPGGHGDFSTNQFSLDAYGRTLLTDISGDKGPTQAHNTIAINGLSQSPVRDHTLERNKLLASSPTPNRWLHGQQFDFAEGRYEGSWRAVNWSGGWKQSGPDTRPQVSHHRQMLHLRPFGALVVLDRLVAPAGETHNYSQSWNFPTLFGQNNVNLDAPGQRLFTSDATGANVFIRHFGPTLAYTKYYGERAADTTVGPAWRGNRVPDGDFYNPDPAVWLPYSEVAATWTGRGPQLLLSLVNPSPASAESVTSATTLTGPGYLGFTANLAAKTHFSAGELVALSATQGTAPLAAWNIQATAENLLLSSTDGRLQIHGLVTGATSLTHNGVNLFAQVPLRDFEFTLRTSDGVITAWKAIQTPADFTWTGTTLPTTQPSYGNENPTLWTAPTGGSWHHASRWLSATIPNSPGARARLGLSTTAPEVAVALFEPLTLGSLAFDHPTTPPPPTPSAPPAAPPSPSITARSPPAPPCSTAAANTASTPPSISSAPRSSYSPPAPPTPSPSPAPSPAPTASPSTKTAAASSTSPATTPSPAKSASPKASSASTPMPPPATPPTKSGSSSPTPTNAPAPASALSADSPSTATSPLPASATSPASTSPPTASSPSPAPSPKAASLRPAPAPSSSPGPTTTATAAAVSPEDGSSSTIPPITPANSPTPASPSAAASSSSAAAPTRKPPAKSLSPSPSCTCAPATPRSPAAADHPPSSPPNATKTSDAPPERPWTPASPTSSSCPAAPPAPPTAAGPPWPATPSPSPPTSTSPPLGYRSPTPAPSPPPKAPIPITPNSPAPPPSPATAPPRPSESPPPLLARPSASPPTPSPSTPAGCWSRRAIPTPSASPAAPYAVRPPPISSSTSTARPISPFPPPSPTTPGPPPSPKPAPAPSSSAEPTPTLATPSSTKARCASPRPPPCPPRPASVSTAAPSISPATPSVSSPSPASAPCKTPAAPPPPS
jgi:autotransporter-associated beta strand protein